MRALHTFAIFLYFSLPIAAIQVQAYNIQNSPCGAPSGGIDISVTGGTPPYAYQWSNGAITEDISGLPPGLYSVTVTDSNNDEANGSWYVYDTPIQGSSYSAQDGHASCTGSSSGQVQVIEYGMNGTPPYSYSPPPDGYDPQGDPYFVFFGSPPGSMVEILVTDANGCFGSLTQQIVSPQLNGGPNMSVSGVQGSCTNGSGGRATISNINDGSFWTAPQWTLFDASQNWVEGGDQVGNTINLTDLAPGNYEFRRNWDPFGQYMAWSCENVPFDRIAFTIPDLGPNCGSVSGRTYIDNDEDCVQDVAEVGVPYQVLEILPGPDYTITDNNGQYSVDLADGAYTLRQTDPTLIQLCPPPTLIPFTIASNQSVIDVANSSTMLLDISTDVSASFMRPGFAGSFHGRVRNLSPQVSGPVTITFTLDDALTYTSATPPPTSIAGNTLTWQFSLFTALQAQQFDVFVLVPVNTPLGTLLTSTLVAGNTLTEATLANNTAVSNDVVTGSYDPNDKRALTSTRASDDQFFINDDEWIDYTIRFQNTGTDTAFTVVITDTLSVLLDLASFQQGVASHPFTVAFKPDRTVEWTFNNILLPDSGTNESASHGLIQFRIRPHLPVHPGTVFENIANIYFDFNAPVITEPSVLVAEFSTDVRPVVLEQMTVSPVPATDRLVIRSSVILMELAIHAADGRIIHAGSANGNNTIVDVQAFPAGPYILTATSVNGQRLTQRFIKQ